MKIPKFTTLLFSFIMASGLIGQVVYVDIDAVGNNDGTSWANAYTDLSIAIDSSGAGSEIWVAEGTYIPGGQIPTRGSSFVIENDIRLYGGFNGTEDNLSQRNILANRTILSGDINGDDIEGDFVNFRSENCRHVVFVAPGVSNGCVIDGFTVSGGHTDGQTAAGDDRRAGAILMYGAPIIRNCVFTANYGHFAGAVYPRAAASTGAQILNCRFQGNLGGFGGAMYVVTNDDIVIRDCIFEDNEADGRGGAVYNSGFSTTFDNCQFLNNTAGSSGGVYHNLIDETDFSSVEFRGCAFIGNRGNFGGAISLYGNGTSLVDSCMFDQNMADAGGGALSIGFTNISMISNSVFSNNEADRGGAIWQQNDTTSVTIKNCDFSTNLCFGSNGGAIYQRGSASLRISDTRFEGNQANFGGAIFMFEDSVDISTLVVERCFFNFNVAEQQAGGINISNSDVYISNCLLANGIVSSGTVGGAISTNASNGDSSQVVLLNSTLYGNVAVIGAGVAQWTDSDTSSMTLMSQNNIYANVGENYSIESGSPVFVSNGGNLSTDLSLSLFATQANDFHATLPLLLDPDVDDFRLRKGSPCIDNGTEEDAPEEDINGDPRMGKPDIGAYEFDSTVATSNIDRTVLVQVFPNPVVDELTVQWEDSAHGKALVDVYDLNGRLMKTRTVNKVSDLATLSFDVRDLPEGKYQILIRQGARKFVGSFIKV